MKNKAISKKSLIDTSLSTLNSKELMEADRYINENTDKINPRYRHSYHIMPPVGWMNDPNGFCYYNNRYHVFYQFYPYDTEWGPMFWGHVTSGNLMDWEVVPTALAPGGDSDQHGIFSGTAIEIDNKLYVYYTGHRDAQIEKDYDEHYKKREGVLEEATVKDGVKQVQCLAVSDDGIHFKKKGEILGRAMIRQNGRIEDFRDPKVWEHQGKYYMVVGSKSLHFRAQVLFYVSQDGINFEYLNYFSLGKEYGTVWECPDLFELGGKHVLIVSPQGKPVIEDRVEEGAPVTIAKHENVFVTFAFIGSFDYESGQFSLERVQDFDHGFDFYAPQSIKDTEGNRVLIAWMNMWARNYVLHQLNHGWNGAMTIPRSLSLINGRVYQYPVKAVNDYRKNFYQADLQILKGEYVDENLFGDLVDIELDFEMIGCEHFYIDLFKAVDKNWGREEVLTLSFDKSKDEVILDRSQSAMINESHNKPNDYVRSIHVYLDRRIKVRILLDVSSCEIFINEGEYAMTSLFYKREKDSKLVLRCDGESKINSLKKWDMMKSLKYD